MQKKKVKYWEKEMHHIHYGCYTKQYSKIVDDEVEIVNSISVLFKELGGAGFGLEREIKEKYFSKIKKTFTFVPLGDLNEKTIFEGYNIFYSEYSKKNWLDSIKKNIRWD